MKGGKLAAAGAMAIVLPLGGTAQCGTHTAVAGAGGPVVYVGMHPPLRGETGVWEKAGRHKWEFLGYTALAAALADAAKHTIASHSSEPTGWEVHVETSTNLDVMDKSYSTVCLNRPPDFGLITFILPHRRVYFDCASWKRMGSFNIKIIIGCLTRIITASDPRTTYDTFYGKTTIWQYGRRGVEMITDQEGKIASVNMNQMTWDQCVNGE